MSTPFEPKTNGSESNDELLVHHDEGDSERSNVGSSVRDVAARIPEELSAIGRGISRTIERAISAKDDYMLAVKVSSDAPNKLGQLVQAGVFGTRAEAASFLIDEGIKPRSALFEGVEQKLGEVGRRRPRLAGRWGEGKLEE